MIDLGFNYRITDIQAALGLSQLGRLDGWVERRNEIAESYRELLADADGITPPPDAPTGSLHGRHLFPVLVAGGAEARQGNLHPAARSVGSACRSTTSRSTAFSHYRVALDYPQDTCPEAERYYEGCISLPMFPGMDAADVERVVAEMTQLVG